ncbi:MULTISPECIES: D-alanyl-D-alanine carboxypeptidase/D-alanyl-D-alanine-endopeptidase [Muribaculaceae]|uniref:D-alanyl-D-alanine carboxypeptidase/D-alanyl-D-alanine-endopeptidase n=1 Tax=Muribaculaceae TaxID=2005473 RepID=UPI00261DC90B|nr:MULTISPECIES: D-alanyl-D-alanine carboxypeptidase [Muribaculaceae]
MNRLKRLITLSMLAVLTLAAAYADAIGDFTSSRAINAPQAAVLIYDLKNDREIASHNLDKPLIPASIMKAVTTATLLEKVGAGYRYVTPVYMTGRIDDGTLDGNILVEASGDPSINTSNTPQTPDFITEIVDALKALKVTAIKGRIIVDESRFPGPAINPQWSPGDLPHAYGTGTHGFNFEDNSSGRRSVADPAGVFRTRLTSALRNAGIQVGGAQIDDHGRKHLLGEHRSAPVDEIMRSCMMRSDNQFAEAMLRLVGDKYGKTGTVEEGARQETEFWKHRDASMQGVRIVDGSGLSRSNRVTARFMGDVLGRMARNPYYASFFPLAGAEGTLKKFLADTELAEWVAMKTGSMKGIQCYAGYKLDEDYAPTHVVVVIMNEMSDRAAARAQVEKLLLATFGSPAAEPQTDN